MIIWSLLESGGGTERQEKKEGKTIEDATPVNKHLNKSARGGGILRNPQATTSMMAYQDGWT
jgi:hypothetical protein